ncbi:MAG TPA: hypothetical protein ENI56_00280 [Candidatus Kaiserbacteria bacterium]|nr:hypothetical protein [Candidatus Kaiserbacteria bacterium]
MNQSVNYSSSATDQDGNMDYLALNWRNPDGTYNWSSGQSSYQATVNNGPYFHYVPSRGSGSYSISFKPSSPGTYKIYSVAHDPSGWVYSSSYTLRVVPKPTAVLSVTPNTISSGQSTRISWSSTNATSCTSTGGFSTGGRTVGSVSSGPLTASTQYQIYCNGAIGSKVYSSAQSVTVLVPAGTLSAYPARVEEGKSTPIKFTWTLNNVQKGVNTCAINKRATGAPSSSMGSPVMSGGTINSSLFPSATHGRANSTNIVQDSITTQTKYYLECNGIAVPNSSVIVNVVPNFNNF